MHCTPGQCHNYFQWKTSSRYRSMKLIFWTFHETVELDTFSKLIWSTQKNFTINIISIHSHQSMDKLLIICYRRFNEHTSHQFGVPYGSWFLISKIKEGMWYTIKIFNYMLVLGWKLKRYVEWFNLNCHAGWSLIGDHKSPGLWSLRTLNMQDKMECLNHQNMK